MYGIINLELRGTKLNINQGVNFKEINKIKPTQISGFLFGGPLGPSFELFLAN